MKDTFSFCGAKEAKTNSPTDKRKTKIANFTDAQMLGSEIDLLNKY